MKTGRFATLERPGEPMQDYAVEKLMENLKDTDLMLFVGQNDALSQKGDVKILIDSLPRDKVSVKHLSDYNHLDYMWAKDANQIINIENGLIDFI